ncbi:MAG: PepSY domain-containing protein [Oscillospiraceae bacterium]
MALDDGSIYSYNGEDYSYEPAELSWDTDEETAAEQLPENVSSEGVRRVTIESEGGRELPCYEFSCINSEGENLKIYVDAQSGKQCRIDI